MTSKYLPAHVEAKFYMYVTMWRYMLLNVKCTVEQVKIYIEVIIFFFLRRHFLSSKSHGNLQLRVSQSA